MTQLLVLKISWTYVVEKWRNFVTEDEGSARIWIRSCGCRSEVGEELEVEMRGDFDGC